MSLGLRISTIVTAVLITASVAGYFWLNYLFAAGDQGGYQIVFYFWILTSILATVPSSLITLGIYLGKRNRKDQNDHSLRL